MNQVQTLTFPVQCFEISLNIEHKDNIFLLHAYTITCLEDHNKNELGLQITIYKSDISPN